MSERIRSSARHDLSYIKKTHKLNMAPTVTTYTAYVTIRIYGIAHTGLYYSYLCINRGN